MSFFLYIDCATTVIYTLSLHDALPIFAEGQRVRVTGSVSEFFGMTQITASTAGSVVVTDAGSNLADVTPVPIDLPVAGVDRKSTRLNSSHSQISYAVFCLKKKKTTKPV